MTRLHHRPYASLPDLWAMHAVLSAGEAAGTRTFYVHPGDLSWWLFYTESTAPLSERVWIWQVDEVVIGWTLFSLEEGVFDLFVEPAWLDNPEYAEMHAASSEEMAARVCARGGKSVGVMWISEDDEARRALLTDQGFRRAVAADDLDLVCLRQALAGERPHVTLPAGSVVREVFGEADLEARARPQAAAFKTRLAWPDYLARFRRLMQSPVYVGAHDTGLILADGTFAAVTIWWVDAVNRVGHFEPVATHPDLQRRGYGRLLLQTCLERMRAAGLTQATVCTGAHSADNIAFYRGCGFEVTHRLGGYVRALESASNPGDEDHQP